MMPVYRYMDSYPHHNNQTGYRTFPTYTQVDPTKSPMVYEPWPYNGSYGYPTPCHSCCNHGNFPGFHGYSHRAPYPQPMPSPVHCYGVYPMPYPEAIPVSRIPPPHYSMELLRYEYDKNTWNYHCCGCPNHTCHQKEDRSVRIEEHEPDVVEKKGNDSLVPVQAKQYPYPVVWIPQDYKEQRKPHEPKVVEHESSPLKAKPVERKNSQEQEQNLWNGWFPLDANKLRYLMNDGDDKRSHDQENEEQKKPAILMPCESRWENQGGNKEEEDMITNQDQKTEDQMTQFPFPIFWMPPQDKKQGEVRGNDSKEGNYSSPKFVENQPFTFKFVPVRQVAGDNGTNNTKVNEENLACQNGTEVRDNTATQKNITVKQIDQPHKEEQKSEDNDKNNLTSKPSGTNGKRQSSSPPKSPKLPPVCLRVDPLPRKKNGNSSSRSPSPPGAKERSQKNSNEMKVSQDSKLHDSSPIESKKVEPKKREAKEIVVTEKTNDGSNGKKQNNGPQVPVDSSTHSNAEVSEKSNSEKAGKDGDECQLKEAAVASEVAVATEKMEKRNDVIDSVEPGDARKLEKKTLSDVEAAIRMQSAYRGFKIRRMEPLKKLKQIAEVREQMIDVRNRVQALESSSDVGNDEKQKVLIGETIMRLLLKLDTVQGLLPSVRDIRKSLATELVTLQEKLDSLLIKKSEPKAEVCHVEPAEELVSKTENNESMLNQETQEETRGNESSYDVSKSAHGVTGSGQEAQDQLLQAVEPEDKAKGEETLLSPSANTALTILSEGDSQELPMASHDLEPEESGSETIMEQKGEVSEVLPEVCKVEFMKTQEENNAPELKQAEEIPLGEDKNDSNASGSSLEGADATCVDDNQDNIWDELPFKVIDDEPVESDKDIQVEKADATAHGADEAEGLMTIHRELEMNELAELPIGAVDDDLESSAGMENHGDEQSKVSECQNATETTSFEDKTPNEINKPGEVLEEKPTAETEEWEKVGTEENKDSDLQPLISHGEDGTQNVLHEDECVSADTGRPSEMPPEKSEKDDESLPLVITEEGVKETQEMKVQAEDHREFVTDEKMNDESYESSEITNDEVSVGLHAQQAAEQEEYEINGSKNDKQLMEKNEKLREMMEKLIEAGKQQLNVISNLNGRVKDLEKKLSRKRNLRTKRNRASPRGCGSSRIKCSSLPV